METKNIKNKFYPILTYILIFGFVGIFSGCNNSKSSNQPNPMPAPISPYPLTGAPNCTTCLNMSQMAFMATTDSEDVRGRIALGLDFYGDTTRGFDFNNPKVPTFYTGLVQAHGRLQIKMIDQMICNAPLGDYEVRTINPGNWQSGVTSAGQSGFGPNTLRLEARGLQNGLVITMLFAQGIIYNNTNSFGTSNNPQVPNRMGGTFIFESINGQVCRSLMGTPLSLELL